MPAFDTWDIIKVPFPCTDRPVRERRPALVVASKNIQEHHGLLWVMMITSSENLGWPGSGTGARRSNTSPVHSVPLVDTTV
jgi:mRNA interferase MazF